MEKDFKESWYLKNVTLGILLLLVGWFPFAALLILPLFIWKSKNMLKFINQQTAYIAELETKVENELKKAKEQSAHMMRETEDKLAQLEHAKAATLADLDYKRIIRRISIIHYEVTPHVKP